MANLYLKQFFYSPHPYPVHLDCFFTVGSTGAVSGVKGSGIKGITRLGVGTYQIQTTQNFNACYNLRSLIVSPVTGSNVTAGSFTTGKTYVITALGNTTWSDVPTGVTAAVGVSFVATGAGSGTGTAKLVGVSGVNSIELVASPTTMMKNTVAGTGSTLIVQCLGPTSSSVTTQIPVDPASGCLVQFSILLSNSSLTTTGL